MTAFHVFAKMQGKSSEAANFEPSEQRNFDPSEQRMFMAA